MTETNQPDGTQTDDHPGPACPRCGRGDWGARVPDVVRKGLYTEKVPGTAPLEWQGTTYYLPLQKSVSEETMLAQRLFPSAKLRQPPAPDFGGISPPLATRAEYIAITAVGVVYLLGIWLVVSTVPILALPMIIGPVLGMVRLQRFLIYRRHARMGDYIFSINNPNNPLFQQALRRAVAKQEEAVRRWHEAYYCYCDKVVFVPGQSGVAVPEDIESLLYPPPP
ncbi:MAG: hypothetical protein ACR2M0_14740 [Chloroflexia bacterium]